MMKIVVAALVAAMLTGCTTSTSFGQCIGVADAKDPGKLYKVDITNVIVAVIFAETFVVPIIVLANQTYCPTGLIK